MSKQQFPDLHVPMTDEDPHLRHRTVPMKVLVLGYPRTGTSCLANLRDPQRPHSVLANDCPAMQKALVQLGFGKCYHMRTAVNEYPRDCAMWLEAFKAKYDGIGTFGKMQWDQLLGNYSSVCDLPAIAFGPELMEDYPDAKIILTNRDIDAWHKSCENTLLQARTYWFHSILQYFDWVTGLVHPMRVKFWQCLFGDNFEANGKAAMQAHYAEIRRLAKSEDRKILEFNLGDEWEPLCDFLGVDAPNMPYPRENEGGNWILKMQERARMRAKAAASKFFRLGIPIACFNLGLWYVMLRYPSISRQLSRQ